MHISRFFLTWINQNCTLQNIAQDLFFFNLYALSFHDKLKEKDFRKGQDMSVKTRLPMGIENFEEMRTMGFYYVDKTRMIRELLENFGKVNLLTRPRRFGKTLNMMYRSIRHTSMDIMMTWWNCSVACSGRR